MDTQLLMKTAMLAGKIMLYSGAETYRVEDTMHHIFKTAENLENAEVLVVMTGITATLKLKNKKAVTSVTRVENHGTNLSHVVNVNDISRRYCGSEITLEEAYKELQSLRKKEYKQIEHCIGQVGVCIGFAIFFGGSIWDVLATCGVGLFLALCDLAGKDMGFNDFIQDVFCSMGVAVATIILGLLLKDRVDEDIVIISAIMPLVPGMAITNAARDTLQGDYLSGTARILEAFLRAAGIALGIGIGIAFFGNIVLKGGIQ